MSVKGIFDSLHVFLLKVEPTYDLPKNTNQHAAFCCQVVCRAHRLGSEKGAYKVGPRERSEGQLSSHLLIAPLLIHMKRRRKYLATLMGIKIRIYAQ